MKRRKAREYVLQFLFQVDFSGGKYEKKDFDRFWTLREEADSGMRDFVMAVAKGTLENLPMIDSAIEKAAENWSLDRMAAVDRSILRFASYELLFRCDIPPAVTINEAIEIARKYSSGESTSFINGILDKIAKGVKGKRDR